jgi:hypothetical protein
VNRTWRQFADANGFAGANYGIGTNYLSICDAACGSPAADATPVADGIREVINHSRDEFRWDYPCHAPHQKRWFQMRVTRLDKSGPVRLAVAHGFRGQLLKLESSSVCWLPELVFLFHDQHFMPVRLQGNSFFTVTIRWRGVVTGNGGELENPHKGKSEIRISKSETSTKHECSK